MTEHESDPRRHDPGAGADPESAAPPASPEPPAAPQIPVSSQTPTWPPAADSSHPYGAEQPTAPHPTVQQPAIPTQPTVQPPAVGPKPATWQLAADQPEPTERSQAVGPEPTAPQPALGPEPTAPQPALGPEPGAWRPGVDQPVTGAPVSAGPTTGAPVSGGPADQPRSPWQSPAPHYAPPSPPQPGYPSGGYPQHYSYPGGGYGQPGYGAQQPGAPAGQPHQPQHGAPIPWAGGGPGSPSGPGGPGGPPTVPGQAWQQPPGPRQPNRVARWVAGVAAALILLVGAGLVGGVVGAAVDGNDSDDSAARAAAAPVINRSSLAEIAQKVEPSVVSITVGSVEGSGVIVSADGYVVTNNHVVAGGGGNTVTVVFDDGKRGTATVVGTDPKTDLAVIKVNGASGLSPAKLGDSAAMQVGDTVLALGSPLGLQGSVTAGIISAKDRTIHTQSEEQQSPFPSGQSTVTSLSGLLQTDAPINPGNSGGALVNTNGEVIGINTAILTSGQGNGSIGVGFAIPSNKVEQVTTALRNGEKVSHAGLGVQVTDAESSNGAVVTTVVANSPAAKAGLQQGDIVTKFDGETISTSDELVAAVQSRKVGEQVQITYTRNGSENTATVTLAEAS